MRRWYAITTDLCTVPAGQSAVMTAGTPVTIDLPAIITDWSVAIAIGQVLIADWSVMRNAGRVMGGVHGKKAYCKKGYW